MAIRPPLRPAQRRDRRPRRPRQDDARRRHAAPDQLLRLARAHGGARHGLERPRAREGHHDPRQEHGDHLRGHARDRRPGHHQRHRHPRPRRLRRRGRARPVDGGRRRAARRRERGPAAADPVRAAQGARVEAPRHPAGQQDRPPGCPHRRGRRGEPRPAARRSPATCTTTCPTSTSTRSSTCPVVYASGRNGAASLEQAGERHAARQRRPRAAVRRDPQARPGARRTTTRRRCRPGSPTSTRRRSSAASRCCASSPARIKKGQTVAWVRNDGSHTNVRVTELLKTRALDRYPAESAARRRHRRHRRHRGHHDRRDDRRPRRHPPAARASRSTTPRSR